MNLSKLSIFSKDTDAVETVKGYEYQKLRTLQTWLISYIEKRNEVIYCDYQEDIFLRNLDNWSSRFIQLKLYSSKNFSFSSVEVKKAISHFFMLFVKGEYKFDEIEFVFETNAAVAGTYKGNDAELLKEWEDNQNDMSVDLIKRSAVKVKEIVLEYVEPFGIKEKDPKLAKDLADTKIVVGELPDSVWEGFAKTIHWNFEDIGANQAVQRVIEDIYMHIDATGFSSAKSTREGVFASLYYKISEKSIDSDSEQRKLDHHLLDSVLLSTGDEDDKWYGEYFSSWRAVENIEHFLAAEFYQVLHAADYCKITNYLTHHADMWIKLLSKYINLTDTPIIFKRKAIYELLWLKFNGYSLTVAVGSLSGYEEMVRGYYSKMNNFDDHESLEAALNLLGVIKAAAAFEKLEVAIEEIEGWEQNLQELVVENLASAEDPSQLCYFHELYAGLLMQQITTADSETIEEIFTQYKRIISMAEVAQTYDIVRLGSRIDGYIKLLIDYKANFEIIERLENFSDELMPLVNKLKGDFSTAKLYSQRGYKYLHSKEPKSILRALNYFHRAKQLYLNDGTMEGYVLALLSISQLYSATGNNYAAKFYALSGIWQATENPKLHKRISDGFGLILHYDFEQGNWFNCLEVFRLYINSRSEFKDPVIDTTIDGLLQKSIVTISSILSMLPKLVPESQSAIEKIIHEMGGLYTEEIKHLKETADVMTIEDITSFIKNKCLDEVVSDAGEKRTIKFKALGTVWIITFENKWLESSVGEELAATLQVILLQFGVAKNDIHFLKGEVNIEIVLSDRYRAPEQMPSNEVYAWKIYTRVVIDRVRNEIKMQASALTYSIKLILDELSLLPEKEFEEEFQRFFLEENLASKTLPGYLYQGLYRDLFDRDTFAEPDRMSFSTERIIPEIIESPALAWEDSLSSKYSLDKSLKLITGRYKNMVKKMYLTIEHIKKDEGYGDFLTKWRNDGWLDWQIVLAMYNHMLSYKTNGFVRRGEYKSDEEFQEAFNEVFFELRKADEKDVYVEFDLDFFSGSDFEFQLNHVMVLILNNWDLENKSRFPNFNFLKEFLNRRFNFGADDVITNSPL